MSQTQQQHPSFPALTQEQCQAVRLARDPRFDGKLFVAVKTTGIFCRPICPAVTPKEENVTYYAHAAAALSAGYRPCLRCRPDSAPDSWAWLGTQTTFLRAIKLIEAGALQTQSLVELAERLGVSDRYLRKLFTRYLGMSPKRYSQFKRLMFAKQLLHQSQLPMGDVAFASGYNSIRRFNDAFKQTLGLSPTEIRRQKRVVSERIQLELAFRPPLDWLHMLGFYRHRAIAGMEVVDDLSYARTIQVEGASGWFRARLNSDASALQVEIDLDDLTLLPKAVAKIRQQFDLDADMYAIADHFRQTPMAQLPVSDESICGIRLPGIWSPFEAGVRAILGQQVSVVAARGLVQQVVDEQGEALTMTAPDGLSKLFPSAATLAKADLSFLRMPGRRRDSLTKLAAYCAADGDQQPEQWLTIPGIGPWTINYVKLRGFSDPDIFLDSDLGVKNAMKKIQQSVSSEQVSPWGSYATFQLWSLL